MDGERLSELRKDRGLTQKQLGDALGFATVTISQYERGLNTPDDETKIKLAEFFNVSLDYLMGLSDDWRPPQKTSQLIYLKDVPAQASDEIEEFLEQIKKNYNL